MWDAAPATAHSSGGRFPNALRIIGIDSSPEMIEAAKDDHPDMEFRICDA